MDIEDSNQHQYQQQQVQNNGALFGVVIPGYPVRTDFIASDPSGMKFTLTLDGIHPTSVSDISFFLLTSSLPPTYGAILYAQVSDLHSGFEIVGAVTADKPSGIFRTNWKTISNEKNNNVISPFASTYTSGNLPIPQFGTVSTPSTITFGVSIEQIENIKNLQIFSKGVEDRVVDVAKKIAIHLFNFMQSFDTNSNSNGTMTVPVNVFERWLTRFQNKYRLDPDFFMKLDS